MKGYNFRDLNMPKRENNITEDPISIKKTNNFNDEKISFIRNIPNKVNTIHNNKVNRLTETKSRNISNENSIKRTHSTLSRSNLPHNSFEKNTINHPDCSFYSKREIAEIDMLRGKVASIKIENKGSNLKIMCFLKPSAPCVNCNLDSYANFIPDANRAINAFVIKEVIIPKEQKQNEISSKTFSPV